MPTLRPPRREPRVLALSAFAGGIRWAVADPWEVRGAGTVHASRITRSLAIRKLIRREKPTMLVSVSKSLAPLVARLGRELGLPGVVDSPPRLEPSIAGELYPELPMRAPTPRLAEIATAAVSVVLHADVSKREYENCRRRKIRRAA